MTEPLTRRGISPLAKGRHNSIQQPFISFSLCSSRGANCLSFISRPVIHRPKPPSPPASSYTGIWAENSEARPQAERLASSSLRLGAPPTRLPLSHVVLMIPLQLAHPSGPVSQYHGCKRPRSVRSNAFSPQKNDILPVFAATANHSEN